MVAKVGHVDAGVPERWSATLATAFWLGVSALIWAGIAAVGFALL